jgi:subtilisin-like proprotein convertase family protein
MKSIKSLTNAVGALTNNALDTVSPITNFAVQPILQWETAKTLSIILILPQHILLCKKKENPRLTMRVFFLVRFQYSIGKCREIAVLE